MYPFLHNWELDGWIGQQDTPQAFIKRKMKVSEYMFPTKLTTACFLCRAPQCINWLLENPVSFTNYQGKDKVQTFLFCGHHPSPLICSCVSQLSQTLTKVYAILKGACRFLRFHPLLQPLFQLRSAFIKNQLAKTSTIQCNFCGLTLKVAYGNPFKTYVEHVANRSSQSPKSHVPLELKYVTGSFTGRVYKNFFTEATFSRNWLAKYGDQHPLNPYMKDLRQKIYYDYETDAQRLQARVDALDRKDSTFSQQYHFQKPTATQDKRQGFEKVPEQQQSPWNPKQAASFLPNLRTLEPLVFGETYGMHPHTCPPNYQPLYFAPECIRSLNHLKMSNAKLEFARTELLNPPANDSQTPLDEMSNKAEKKTTKLAQMYTWQFLLFHLLKPLISKQEIPRLLCSIGRIHKLRHQMLLLKCHYTMCNTLDQGIFLCFTHNTSYHNTTWPELFEVWKDKEMDPPEREIAQQFRNLSNHLEKASAWLKRKFLLHLHAEGTQYRLYMTPEASA